MKQNYIFSGVSLVLFILMNFATSAKAQQLQVSGIVEDLNSNTIPGVNILVKGQGTGTATDVNGKYNVSVSSLQDTLVFSFVGYKTQTVPIKGQTKINVTLRAQTLQGNEITVVGYGEQSTETVTSSVSSVSGDDISKVPASSVGNALTGKTPGLQIIQSSGQPGQTDPTIFLRGVSSLNSGRSQPIFVLDGVIVRSATPITQLDPEMIESISVLKDASATSIYGIEGANGAIVVKTKRGDKGPIKVSLSTSAGFRTPTVYQDYGNSYQEATAYNEAQQTDGVSGNNLRFSDKALNAFRTHSNPLIYPDVNWTHYLVNNRSFQSRTNVNISGGTDDVRFFVSGAYLKQDGFFKTFASDFDFNPTYDRYNFQSNLDVDVTSSTKLSITAAGKIRQRTQIRSNGALWQQIYHSAPYAGRGIVDGKLIASSNFYIPGPKHYGLQRYYGHGYNNINRNNLNIHLSALQDITKGLSFQLKGAYNVYFLQNKFRSSSVARYEPYFKSDVDPAATGDSTIVYQKFGSNDILNTTTGTGKDRSWYVEGRLNYDHDFGPHSVKALLLYNQRKEYYPDSYRSIPRDLVSTVGRINYNYKKRYLLEFSMGYNGSENFAKGKRFGFFPAVSGGWILTNEPYFPDIPFLDFFKLRASYGIVGNDRGIGRFLYLQDSYNSNAPGYNFGNDVQQDKPGTSEGRLGNPGVTWERSEKQNYGLNLHMFDDKLEVKADYFRELRSNILTTRNTIPSYVAANLPAANIGRVQNHGYEIQATWQGQSGDFTYSIGGNVTFARNKILYMDEVPRNEPYQRRTGQPVGQPFGYVFDGFYTQEEINNLGNGTPDPTYAVKAGFLKYKDLNGDGIINEDDTQPIGYPQDVPEYTFGSNLRFKYKNVDLSMTWAAATHVSTNLIFAPYRIPFGAVGDRTIMQWQYDGRWTPEKGQNAKYPRLSLNANGLRNSHDSNFWLRDASYIRLKNVEVGYNFGPEVLQTLRLNRLRIYANGYNLITFSGLMENLSIDPEQPAQAFFSNYPVMKTYNFGIRVGF